MNSFTPIVIMLAIILGVLPIILSGQVVINEYSASNLERYTDNYGEYEDWIELYNTGGSSVDLGGYYIKRR